MGSGSERGTGMGMGMGVKVWREGKLEVWPLFVRVLFHSLFSLLLCCAQKRRRYDGAGGGDLDKENLGEKEEDVRKVILSREIATKFFLFSFLKMILIFKFSNQKICLF